MLAEMLEMLAEMLEMLAICWLRCLRCLAQMLGQMLAIEMLLIEIECSEQQMSADDAGRCCGLGRCYWQMLAYDAGPAGCCWQNGVSPEIERIEARIEAIEAK
jgi:hypothetical protein